MEELKSHDELITHPLFARNLLYWSKLWSDCFNGFFFFLRREYPPLTSQNFLLRFFGKEESNGKHL